MFKFSVWIEYNLTISVMRRRRTEFQTQKNKNLRISLIYFELQILISEIVQNEIGLYSRYLCNVVELLLNIL